MQQYDRIATENVCVLVLKDATYNQSNTQTNQSVQLFNARSEKPRSSQLSLPHRITSESLGGLDSQVGSVVGQNAKVTGSIPGGAKVLGTDGICKYLPVSVSSYVEVCLCSVCIN